MAGRSVERIWNLSDSVFGFAMTLLVLRVAVPGPSVIHSEGDLSAALMRGWPRIATYLLSFLTLGLFWLAQQAQLHFMARSDRNATWLNFAYLAMITMMPGSTMLLSEYIAFRPALLAYWLNVFLVGMTSLTAWNYTVRAGLLKPEATPEVIAVVRRRAITSQCLLAIGAALCVFGTSWSIGFILLVQIHYALGWSPEWLKRVTGG